MRDSVMINASNAFNLHLGDIQDRIAVRSWFLDQFMNAPTIILELYNSPNLYSFGFVLTKPFPICLKTWTDGAVGNSAASMRTFFNSPIIPLEYSVNLPTTLNRYFLLNGYTASDDRLLMVPLVAGYDSYSYQGSYVRFAAMAWDANAYEKGMTIEAVFELHKNLITDYYSRYVTKAARRFGGGIDSFIPDQMSASENYWPEIPGMAQAYIDNVAVYLPQYMDIDGHMSLMVGSDFLVTYFTRAPSLEYETTFNQMKSLVAWLNFIFLNSPGSFGDTETTGAQTANPIVGAAANTWGFIRTRVKLVGESVRVAFPRVRAFGRQLTRIPGYWEYKSRIKYALGAMGLDPTHVAQEGPRGPGEVRTITFNGKTVEYVKAFNKMTFFLSQEAYDSFVVSLDHVRRDILSQEARGDYQ